jgi:hypothetical protein
MTEARTRLAEQCPQLAKASWVSKPASLCAKAILPTGKAAAVHLVGNLQIAIQILNTRIAKQTILATSVVEGWVERQSSWIFSI